MRIRMLAALVPALILMLPAQALIVDEFDDPIGGHSASIPLVDASPHIVFHGGGMLGSERDVEVVRVGADGLVTLLENTAFNLSRFSVGGVGSPGATWTALLQWDGVDGSMALGHTGLGGVDLTDGGTKTHLTVLADTDLPASMTLRVFTDAANWAEQTFALGGVGFNNYSMSFAGGWTASAGVPDFSSVGAVELFLDGTVTVNTDVTIDFVRSTTVPEPGTLALLGGGLIAVVRRRRRK